MGATDWAEMLNPEDAILVMIDHQAGLMLYPGDIDTMHLRSNAVALAKVAKMHRLPVVLCAAAQGPRGPIGPILAEITGLFPDTEVIYRTKINSWHDPRFRQAVEATGRKQIIIAGIDASFCAGLPAKSMIAEGYTVWECVDASGNVSELTRVSTMANLTQAGVRCCNWVDVACQLLGDWANEEQGKALACIYAEHLPRWGMLEIIDEARKAVLRGPQA